MDFEQFKKECYLLVRNQNEYVKDGSFQNRLGNLILKLSKEQQMEAFALVEEMIAKKRIYFELEEKYMPILIYKGEEVCHDILNFFAEQMKEALECIGQPVEVFDARLQPLEDLFELSKKEYKAIFGVQTYLFFLKLQNGEVLHNLFRAPMYNMIFDHPVTLHEYWVSAPKNLTLLTHDRNYLKFAKDYYADYLGCEILCPAGVETYTENEECMKEYDLTFVGSYHSWYEFMMPLKQLHRQYPGFARELICYMKHNPKLTYECCFDQIYPRYKEKISLSKLELLVACKQLYFVVMHFYRREVIQAILDMGQQLHVYGDTWQNADFEGYDNLMIHDELSIEEGLDVYAKSKITLNIMSWHKDGMTERIANGMLGHAVVLSDETSYLREHFEDGNEIVLYPLDQLEILQAKIEELMRDPGRAMEIANAGYNKAIAHHCWINRAKELLAIIEK